MLSVDPSLISLPARSVDSVCGAELTGPQERMSVTFSGARYFFCGDACRQAFKRDARGYAERHPDAGHRPPAALPPSRDSPFEILRPGTRVPLPEEAP